MSLIESLSGLGGNFFGGTRATANASNATGTSGNAQNMESLLKNLSPENVQSASSTEASKLLSGSTATSDSTATGRSIFADTSSSSATGKDPFVSTLNDFIKDVNDKSITAEKDTQDILTGKSDNIHQAMISMQEASISFDLLIQVRNKLTDAYKELSRISA